MTMYICVFKSAIVYDDIVVNVAENGFLKIMVLNVTDIVILYMFSTKIIDIKQCYYRQCENVMMYSVGSH